MKSYNHLYEDCLVEHNRQEAIKMARKSKRIRKIIKKRHLSDAALLDLSYEWVTQFQNAFHTPIEIYDGISRKVRHIIVPTLEELIVQHCVVNALRPIFTKGMYLHTYASIPGRGPHKAKKFIEKWLRDDPKNTKYVLKMDIRHFFDEVPHDILKSKLAKVIHDEKMLYLLDQIINVTDSGIPLGFYTSQWFSNWYLQELDHFIKEELHAVYYVRYMDDMVIFGSNKKVLHRMRLRIDSYLRSNLGLRLKDNWQVFRFAYEVQQPDGETVIRGRDLDFMGFRFYRDHTVLRRSVMYKASRKAARIAKKEGLTIHDARQMLSYLGYVDCTDTYNMYLKWIKPKVSFQKLKRKVSRFDKHNDLHIYLDLASLYTS